NATNFAGHTDWRLPSEVGRNGPPRDCSTCNPRELETILLAPSPCSTRPCIDPIFGPTATGFNYWSSSGVPNPLWEGGNTWSVRMQDGAVINSETTAGGFVRAVRNAGGAVTTTSTSTSSSTTTSSTSQSVTSSTSSSSTTSSM